MKWYMSRDQFRKIYLRGNRKKNLLICSIMGLLFLGIMLCGAMKETAERKEAMKKRYFIFIFAMIGILFGSIAYGKNSFLSDWGKYLSNNKEVKNGAGKYSTVAKEYAADSDNLVDLDSIFAVGKDVLISVKEVEQAETFYTLSGYDKAEAKKTAIAYMEKYNALYVEALKNGYFVTDEEINEKIEELKKLFSESDQKDELEKLINEFGSEDAYWEYEREVYKKSLPIEKYRMFLEKEFSAKETSEKGSEEYQNEWIKWYDTYQGELAKKQNFIVVSEMEEGALVELLKRYTVDEISSFNRINSSCSIPNDRAEVKNETTILTDAQANSIGNSIYETIYRKYSGIAEIKDPKVTLTDGEESDEGILIAVDISMNWTSTVSSANSQFLKGMEKYIEEDPNNLVKSAYASYRDNLDNTYNKESVTGYTLLAEIPGDFSSQNYKLYDCFTVEEGILKAEFDSTAQTNDKAAFEAGYNFAKSIVAK